MTDCPDGTPPNRAAQADPAHRDIDPATALAQPAHDPTRTSRPDAATSPASELIASLPGVPQARNPSRYHMLGEHGRGGLGKVSRAHDIELGRDVAIKELLSRTVLHELRFMREALITARLEHPSIVPVYEAGRWPDGTPFYAMKLVAGRSLRHLLADRKTVEERIQLLHHVIAVADAIAYAHGRNIIHRDLKPSNVIIGDFGETVVIDWGLAKDISTADVTSRDGDPSHASVDDGLTSAGSVLGTPAYMAPEQARGEPVDQRADVFAIGAMLWELCALQRLTPHHPGHIQRTLHRSGIDPDLAAIVAKACDPDPARRYRDAAALATDLKAFKTGARIAARTYSPWGLLAHWIRRHRLFTYSIACAIVLTIAGSVVYVRNIATERDRADAAVITLEKTNGSLARERASAIEQRNALILAQAGAALDSDPTLSIEWLKTYPADGAEWDRVQVIAADAQSRGISRHILPTMSAASSITPDGRMLLTAGPYEDVRLWDLASGRRLRSMAARGRVTAVRILPPGHTIAVGDHSGDITLWSAVDGARTLLGKLENGTLNLEISLDGNVLASSSMNEVVVWDMTARRRTWSTSSRQPITMLAIAADGQQIAFSTANGVLHVQDLAHNHGRQFTGHVGPINAIAFSADRRSLVTGGRDHSVRLWDIATGTGRVLGWHDALIRDIRFSPTDPTLIASGGADNKVRLWSTAGNKSRVLSGHTDMINAVVFSSDGRTLATVSPDRQVRLWDITSGDSRVLSGHRGDLGDVAFSPDRATLVSSGYDQGTRIWSLAPPPGRLFGRHEFEALRAVFSPDGRLIASIGSDRTARLWDISSSSEIALPGSEYTALSVAIGVTFTKHGDLLASGGDNTAHLWNVKTGERRDFIVPSALIRRVALAADGRFIAAGASDGNVHLWEVASGAATTLAGHTGEVATLAFLPRGDRLISAASDGSLWSWDLASSPFRGERIATHRAQISQLAISPDGEMVASASDDGEIQLWSPTRHASRVLAGHTRGICELVFSPDGRSLASASMDKTARIWNVVTGESHVLRGHDEPVRAVAFSPDGRIIATGANDKTVRLWNLDTQDMTILRGHSAVVRSVAFDPHQQQLISASEDATLRLWQLDRVAPVPHERTQLMSWLQAQTSAEFPARSRTTTGER